MEHETLTDMISALEYGTKLHISVLFLSKCGNERTNRPFSQKVHQCPVCDMAKSTQEGYAACFRCRNTVVRMAKQRKKSFAGLCIKGVYEYCRPVVRSGETLAIVFVGNILMDNVHQRLRLRRYVKSSLLKTMQTDFTEKDCARIADLLESYIHYLLDKYGETTNNSADFLIENIKSYLEENLLFDVSMVNLAATFNYNEKYLGRLFKSKTGQTIREYCNSRKVENAKQLLKHSRLNISDIAVQTGFNNVTYFNRIFKKITGKPPQEFRHARK